MKTVLSFVALFGSALAQWRTELRNEHYESLDLVSSFEEFKEYFDMKYTADEEFKRFSIFSQTLKNIAQFNSEEHSSTVRANQFAALTDEEFRNEVLGGGGCFKDLKPPKTAPVIVDYPDTGGEKDWHTLGCVNSIKFQGSCGSCWAFSTADAVECAIAVKQYNGGQCLEKPIALSEQQLVDCDHSSNACHGGDMYLAMTYLESTGLCSEAGYPYEARNSTCRIDGCGEKYGQLKSHVEVTPKSEAALRAGIDKGCVSVGVQADQFAFKYYARGVMTATCGADLNHGVLAMAYGNQFTVTSGSQDFWRLKNSWGVDWGYYGYGKICRNCNKNNGQGQCGVLMHASYPVLK